MWTYSVDFLMYDPNQKFETELEMSNEQIKGEW